MRNKPLRWKKATTVFHQTTYTAIGMAKYTCMHTCMNLLKHIHSGQIQKERKTRESADFTNAHTLAGTVTHIQNF